MAFTEFYCDTATGANINAGDDKTVVTSTNGDWGNAAANRFTAASGTPFSGVSVGDFASIYVDGATVAVYIGRVTAVNAGGASLDISSTAKSGTAPGTSATGRSCTVGGNVTGSVGSVATGGITTASFASGATIPRCTLTDTITTYTGNTVQTGDSYARLATYASSYFSPTAGNASTLATLAYVESGSIQSGSTTNTIVLGTGASSTNDAYKFYGIRYGNELAICTGYNGATKIATVHKNWVTTPTTGSYWVTADQFAPMDSSGNFTNDTASQTDLEAIANDVDTMYTAIVSGGVALSAATKNSIADHCRRRTQANVEASADGDALSHRSLYGMIQQAQKSNTTANSGKITVYKLDGTTELGQFTITVNAGSDPMTGIS